MQVYVHEQGAVVRKRGGLLWITKGKDTLKELPMLQVDQLVCMGNVQVTTQAGTYMVREGIDVVFLSTTGNWKYRLDRSESKFAELRRQQLHLTNNAQQSLEIARAIIVGKINNQRVVLQRRAEQDRQAAKALKGMLSMLKKVKSAKNLDQLRGFEGKAAAYYFDGVRTFFPANWEFTKREYYPPPDAANALLSYCYTLLRKDVKASIHIVGLDPAMGFFHVLGDNRASLAFDLMEEFRPSICDIVVLSLVLEGRITLTDFEYTAEAGLPIRLTAEGRETLIHAYEQRLAERIFHPMAQGETSLRNAIEYQVRQMRWIVEGKTFAFETIQLQ